MAASCYHIVEQQRLRLDIFWRATNKQGLSHLHALPHVGHCHWNGVGPVQPGHGSGVVSQSFERQLAGAFLLSDPLTYVALGEKQSVLLPALRLESLSLSKHNVQCGSVRADGKHSIRGWNTRAGDT